MVPLPELPVIKQCSDRARHSLRAGSSGDQCSPQRLTKQFRILRFGCLREVMMLNFVAVVVEDDPLQRGFLAEVLDAEGLQVVECANAEAAELIIAGTGPELRALVTDVELGDGTSGVQLAQYAKRQFPGPERRHGLRGRPIIRSARHSLFEKAF
jgi:CheY-like chemotaxis protein